jgi:hypothetical protein
MPLKLLVFIIPRWMNNNRALRLNRLLRPVMAVALYCTCKKSTAIRGAASGLHRMCVSIAIVLGQRRFESP